MMLWTIQTMEAWDAIRTRGSLRGNRCQTEKAFRSAYDWMTRQMRQRIGPPPTRDSKPIWAWYQWRGDRQRKPDLRCGGHLERGQKGVRVEFAVEDSRVLLSDFDLWHFALNYWYLPTSEADGDVFERKLAAEGQSFFTTKPLPIERYHRAIEASWNRIFDLDFLGEGITSPRKQKCLQACLWEVFLADVTDVTEFTAR
ncbi:MAG: DUF3841 domain-containing protein [Verrucomicrobiota bacterium]